MAEYVRASDRWLFHETAEFTAVGDAWPRALGSKQELGTHREGPEEVEMCDEGGGLWGQGSEGGGTWQVPGLWAPAQHLPRPC